MREQIEYVVGWALVLVVSAIGGMTIMLIVRILGGGQ